MKSSTTKNTMKLNTRKRVQIHFKKPSLTKQYFKNECNINNIIAKFAATGQLPLANNQEPQYGFAPDLDLDLKSSIDMVNALKSEFYKLPKDIQKSFDNNPNNYGEFLSDYENNPEKYSADLVDVEGTEISAKPAEKLPETE